MKKIFFLITIILSTFTLLEVKAQDRSFYEAERVGTVWMNKKATTDTTTQSVYIMMVREKGSNKLVYCVEPFAPFSEEANYTKTGSPPNLTKEQILDITLYSYYGYGYKSHQDPNWYGATQLLIWQTANPDATYYISDYRYGPPSNVYDEKIAELKSLVEAHKKPVSFNGNSYTIFTDEKLTLTDTNNVLDNYTNQSSLTTIANNTLTVSGDKAGAFRFELVRKTKDYNHPIVFYKSPTAQDLVDIGDPYDIINTVSVRIIENDITIEKVASKDLEYPTSATLFGTKLGLYNGKNELVQTIVLDNSTTKTIHNLPLGFYKLKELEPSPGFTLNKEVKTFTLQYTTEKMHIKIANDPIEAKVKIKKSYGTDNNFQPEKNISFNVYYKDKLLKTITTDDKGETEITLPYGEFQIVQLTTTEGYEKIEPITVNIKTTEPITYDLKDYKIEVPNTFTKSLLEKIIEKLRTILCDLKSNLF